MYLRFYFNICKCLCALVEDLTAVFKFILCPFKDADKIVVPDQFAPKTYRFLVRAEANFSRGFLWSFVICSKSVEHSLSFFNFVDIPFNEWSDMIWDIFYCLKRSRISNKCILYCIIGGGGASSYFHLLTYLLHW